jgi:hypothetical protein
MDSSPPSAAKPDTTPTAGARARAALLAAAGGLALALVLWGGYSHTWPWTGINGRTATLWDWLHLLLLPLVFAVLPTWVRRDTRMDPRTKSIATTCLVVFAIVVVAGYTIPWAWTGFRGNTVWDWLGLVVLPVTLLMMPWFAELRGDWRHHHTMVSAIVLTVFVAVVLGGYLGHWSWTGFTGNTLWDWMHLLLLPLLLPTVIVPALTPMAMGRVVVVAEEEDETPTSAAVTVAPPLA